MSRSRKYKVELLQPQHIYKITEINGGKKIKTKYPIISVSTIANRIFHDFNPVSAIFPCNPNVIFDEIPIEDVIHRVKQFVETENIRQASEVLGRMSLALV